MGNKLKISLVVVGVLLLLSVLATVLIVPSSQQTALGGSTLATSQDWKLAVPQYASAQCLVDLVSKKTISNPVETPSSGVTIGCPGENCQLRFSWKPVGTFEANGIYVNICNKGEACKRRSDTPSYVIGPGKSSPLVSVSFKSNQVAFIQYANLKGFTSSSFSFR